MTPRQKEIYNYICGYIEENGYAPTHDEIRLNSKIKNRSQVFELIKHLIRQNYLAKEPGKRRSLTIIQHYCQHCGGNLAIPKDKVA